MNCLPHPLGTKTRDPTIDPHDASIALSRRLPGVSGPASSDVSVRYYDFFSAFLGHLKTVPNVFQEEKQEQTDKGVGYR